MMLSVIFFIFTLFGFLHGSQDRFDSKSNEEFVVHLLTDEECAASLIEPQYILTSASCLSGPSAVVTYGCSDLNDSNCENTTVIAKRIHPKYQPLKKWLLPHSYDSADIAVGKLATEIKNIAPIPLNKWKNLKSGDVTLVGYVYLQEEEMPHQRSVILSLRKGRSLFHSADKIFIEATDSDVQSGYLGGPLLVGRTLYGVCSSQLRNKINQTTGLEYVDVKIHKRFIATSIRSLKKS